MTPDNWADLESLSGVPGGSIVCGCWCMHYRRSGELAVSGSAAEEDKRQLRELAGVGVVPGLVGYVDDAPAGWISPGPRRGYAELRRSPIMKPADERAVWSIVCTYVAKCYRSQGVQTGFSGRRFGGRASRPFGWSRPTRSTSLYEATTTSCSSDHGACTSVPDSSRSCAARPRDSSCVDHSAPPVSPSNPMVSHGHVRHVEPVHRAPRSAVRIPRPARLRTVEPCRPRRDLRAARAEMAIQRACLSMVHAG